MKQSLPQPLIRRRRNEYLKGTHSLGGHSSIPHGHCHTRGELPGRLARNWKADQFSTSTAPSNQN